MFYDPDAIEIGSDSEESTDTEANRFPQFTNIVHVSGRELSLGQQNFEVQLAVRKAMDYMLEYLLFRNGFPSLAIRAIWSRRAFINASTSLESSLGAHSAERYKQLSERFKTDATYVRELGRLVCIYI